jgi:hypothetical protein
MQLKHFIVAFALPATSALAGMYDQPWAIVETGAPSATRNEARLAITKVDGQSTRDPRQTDPIPPGPHKVKISFDTARGVVGDTDRELEMNLEGCTRYLVVANYESKTNPDWQPKIYSEPIGECVRKFKKAN